MTGEAIAGAEYSWSVEGTQVPLDLEPYGSVFVVFGSSAAHPLVTDSNVTDLCVGDRSAVGTVETPGTYFVTTTSHTRLQHEVESRFHVPLIWSDRGA